MLWLGELPHAATQFHLQGILLLRPNSQHSAPGLAFWWSAHCPCTWLHVLFGEFVDQILRVVLQPHQLWVRVCCFVMMSKCIIMLKVIIGFTLTCFKANTLCLSCTSRCCCLSSPSWEKWHGTMAGSLLWLMLTGNWNMVIYWAWRMSCFL